jgi:hypothetical protein
MDKNDKASLKQAPVEADLATEEGGGFGGGGSSGSWLVHHNGLSEEQRDVLQGKVVRAALSNPRLRQLIDAAALKHAKQIRATRKK